MFKESKLGIYGTAFTEPDARLDCYRKGVTIARNFYSQKGV
jgi:hypothetical protein